LAGSNGGWAAVEKSVRWNSNVVELVVLEVVLNVLMLVADEVLLRELELEDVECEDVVVRELFEVQEWSVDVELE